MTSRRDVLKLGIGVTALAGIGSAAGRLQLDGDPESPDSVGLPRFYSAGTLRGAAEVPPVESDGTGAALLRLSTDGSTLHYVLLVARIEDVTQAHIHVGPRDENGPVVAFLFGREDESGTPVSALEQGVTENGVLAEGSITAEELVGPLAGGSIADLVSEMNDENAYVNVHTESVPSGEIRGQLGRVDQLTIELTETERIEAGERIGIAAERTVSLLVSESSGNGDRMEPPTETPDGNETMTPETLDGEGGGGDDGNASS